MNKWKETNINYWDEVAGTYDALYNDGWSSLEDSYMEDSLKNMLHQGDKVLDLGCGLCLGYQLLCAFHNNFSYTGIDISKEMVSKAKAIHPELKIVETSMSDLSMIKDESVDLVICINTSFSFVFDTQKTITEIKRVLKKGGRLLISVLSKWSLRRLIRLKFAAIEEYATRNSSLKATTKAHVFSSSKLKSKFQANGFSHIKVNGYNSFAGILNRKWAWKLNLLFSQLNKDFSHDLILTATY